MVNYAHKIDGLTLDVTKIPTEYIESGVFKDWIETMKESLK